MTKGWLVVWTVVGFVLFAALMAAPTLVRLYSREDAGKAPPPAIAGPDTGVVLYPKSATESGFTPGNLYADGQDRGPIFAHICPPDAIERISSYDKGGTTTCSFVRMRFVLVDGYCSQVSAASELKCETKEKSLTIQPSPETRKVLP